MQEIVQSIGAGWFNIKIRNTNLSISYIGDELLDALIIYYKPQVIKFNLEELGEVHLIIDWYISLHRYKQVLTR